MSFLVYPPVSGTRRVSAGSSVGSPRGKISFCVGWSCLQNYIFSAHLSNFHMLTLYQRGNVYKESANLKNFNQALTLKNKHMAFGWHLLKFMVDMQKSPFIEDALEALGSRQGWDSPARVRNWCLGEESRPRQRRSHGHLAHSAVLSTGDLIFQRFGLDLAALTHSRCCPAGCLCNHYVLAFGTRVLPLIAAVCLCWYLMYWISPFFY